MINLIPIKYKSEFLDNNGGVRNLDITVEERDLNKYAVCFKGLVYNSEKDFWDYEPLPSSRTKEFLSKTRFSLEETKKIIETMCINDVIEFKKIEKENNCE